MSDDSVKSHICSSIQDSRLFDLGGGKKDGGDQSASFPSQNPKPQLIGARTITYKPNGAPRVTEKVFRIIIEAKREWEDEDDTIHPQKLPKNSHDNKTTRIVLYLSEDFKVQPKQDLLASFRDFEQEKPGPEVQQIYRKTLKKAHYAIQASLMYKRIKTGQPKSLQSKNAL